MRVTRAMLAILVPAIVGAQATPKAPAKQDAKAPAKQDAKATAKMDTKTPAKAPTKAPAASPTAGMSHAMSTASTGHEGDDFHKILMESWHAASGGDLKPARANGAATLTAALAWRRVGDKNCKSPNRSTLMAQMITDLRSYADASKREASDDAINVTLRMAHNSFEDLEKACEAAK